MVTSNKQPDKKVVKMAEQENSAVMPQRTLLGEVNEQITCPLCRGYYIDATTIVECLHSFCRSCIIKHLQIKSYCPVCEMMINSAKPNIKLDKALQDIVYKLVPGLFQKEMERRQQFYASRPGPAASATPEQRGEDTERIIFSPEDVISFSLEYSDATDTDSISSKSSDSNEAQPTTATSKRYLQCPAVVNINHLKKFLSMKFDIDSSQFAIDILYKRVPLPDYYTLMDIAYIYNWKRNEPMRFFYQIIDYVAIRNRLFDINRKGTHFTERKSSPTCTEDTNVSSPNPNLNDHGSEASSGPDSPMPADNNLKKLNDTIKKEGFQKVKDNKNPDSKLPNVNRCPSPLKKNDDEVEKSQFLNSFELTAKHSSTSLKTSPNKCSPNESVALTKEAPKNLINSPKIEDTLKRKIESSKIIPEMKKIKIELEKTKMPISDNTGIVKLSNVTNPPKIEIPEKVKGVQDTKNASTDNSNKTVASAPVTPKDIKPPQLPTFKQQSLDGPGQKRNVAVSQMSTSPKRKPSDTPVPNNTNLVPKTVSPLKLQIPKPEALPVIPKHVCDPPKPVTKKMPDLKPSVPVTSSQSKGHPVGKLRMDLLANNCDPIMDRSKILSQVKSSLPLPTMQPTSGDPLKSLFDSCKINIPSSLSITLTDQKLDPRSPSDQTHTDPKKNIVNKNLTSGGSTSHKVPSPPVHNYIEILKLPDNDPKKQNKPETSFDKNNSLNKVENSTVPSKPPTKSSETSAKGPVPNLKPISDTKLAKAQAGNLSGPKTFQQTFEQQLQSLQTDKKTKLPKNKSQVPKLVPATPKSFSAANNLNNPNKPNPINSPVLENKASAALDLSTPHNIQSQLGPQQTKAFETMQSIANLAKKQSMPSKLTPMTMTPANLFSSLSSRALSTGAPPLRVPSASTINQLKLDKLNASQISASRKEQIQKTNQIKHPNNSNTSVQSPSFTHNSPNATLPSPRSQTRSPSSSPKLVIAEDKQGNTSVSEHNINQSNQITSTQISNANATKTESPKPSPGPSKIGLKPIKPLMPNKITGIRQPITPTLSTNYPMNSPADYLAQTQFNLHAQQAILNNIAWVNAQRHFDMFKNVPNTPHQNQNDFKSKDKQ